MIGKKRKREFYLDEYNNILFITFIMCNILLFILSYFVKLNLIVSIVANILTISGSLGIFFYNNKKNEKTENIKEELKEIYVERKNWFNEIINKKGIVFLTGESGIGKTYLLNQLMENFDEKHISYDFEENNYFFDLKLDKMYDKEYIILDQFERALSFDNILRNIEIIKSLVEKKIIISIRKEYVGDVYKLFEFDDTIHFVWLDYRKEELVTIEDYLQDLARETKNNLKEHSLYSKILSDAEVNKISLIQLSYLGREIQCMEEDYVEDRLKEYTYDYDNVIKDYLKVQLDSYEFSEIAYVILYLLCQDHKGQYINEFKDFQNIAIESETKVTKTVKFLREQGWIKKVKDNENKRSELTEHYEISHDYFMKLFEKLCMEQIEPNIRNNVKYYNVNCQDYRGSKVGERGTWKIYINKVCQSFLKTKNKNYLNIGLYLMMSFIMFANLHILTQSSYENQTYWMLVAINLMVGESIYYVYNYYYHFLSIYKWHYFIGVFIGTISCIMSFVFMNYWAISLGIEVCVVGIIMGCICRNIRTEEKSFFKARCYVFFGIGFIIIILGIVFPVYTQGKIILTCPLFALYGIYMLMGILSHINRNYIHAIVGKTLYGGRRMKI
ncbi:MAG: ATP-binding protein [Lachnospiraceae bacterium]|jgi:Fe2+ or Zn2+ uptake regulation protein|nr:ATP-binding protein [Lachnospiraceae bacterium]